MADKITNFEDYKNRDIEKPVEKKEVSDEPVKKVDHSETMEIGRIQIEDPYNFFTEEEREEYFRQRQKEEMEKQASQGDSRDIIDGDYSRDEEFYREDDEDDEDYDGEYRDDYPDEFPEEYREDYRGDYRGDYREDYREDYDDDEDYPEDEDYNEPDDKLMRIVVRIASVMTGIIILGLIIFGLKVKVIDKFFPRDPEQAAEEQAQETPEPVSIPEGYQETNDTVVVNAEYLNLRSTPDTSGDGNIEEKATNGTELKRLAVSPDGKWAFVEYNGKHLYGYMKYLSTP